MNRLSKSALSEGRSIDFECGKADLRDYEIAYPILAIANLSYKGKAYMSGKYPHVEMDVSCDLTLEDSYDAQPFDSHIEFFDEADILPEEDEEGEGYIMEGGSIDLDLLAYSMLRSSLPIKILRPGSKLPEGNGSVTFVSEGEETESEGSPFDILLEEDKA